MTKKTGRPTRAKGSSKPSWWAATGVEDADECSVWSWGSGRIGWGTRIRMENRKLLKRNKTYPKYIEKYMSRLEVGIFLKILIMMTTGVFWEMNCSPATLGALDRQKGDSPGLGINLPHWLYNHWWTSLKPHSNSEHLVFLFILEATFLLLIPEYTRTYFINIKSFLGSLGVSFDSTEECVKLCQSHEVQDRWGFLFQMSFTSPKNKNREGKFRKLHLQGKKGEVVSTKTPIKMDKFFQQFFVGRKRIRPGTKKTRVWEP